MSAPSLAEQIRGLGRVYRHPATNQHVPSVTTVLGVLDKPAIPRWAANTVAQYVVDEIGYVNQLVGDDQVAAYNLLKGLPWEKRDTAADRGSDLHDVMHAIAEGRDPAAVIDRLDADARTYLPGLMDWLDEFNPSFMHVERTVFGDGYAGTFDFLADIPDVGRALGDYKTRKSGSKQYPEAALQLAALRHASLIAVPDPDGTIYAADGSTFSVEAMPPVDVCVGVLFTPDGYEMREMRADEAALACFLACRDVWEWKRSRSPVGRVLQATGAAA